MLLNSYVFPVLIYGCETYLEQSHVEEDECFWNVVPQRECT